MPASEFRMMEISEFQQLIPAHVGVDSGFPEWPGDRSDPAIEMVKDAAGSPSDSLLTATQAVDLSTSSHGHSLGMAGERTPPSHGEVPGYVLARVDDVNDPSESQTVSRAAPLTQTRSSVRVCLGKLFNSKCADAPTQEDVQASVPSSLLTMLQCAETPNTFVSPQTQKMMTTEGINPFESSNTFIELIYNPVTNLSEQVGHICQTVEPKCQDLKNFSFVQPEAVVRGVDDTAASSTSSRNSDSAHSSQIASAAMTAPGSIRKPGRNGRKRAGSQLPLSERREIHNIRERHRRKTIRSCCDELNLLVPFCSKDCDKATTLRWTTAFLRYINETYGDIVRQVRLSL
ncbi:uncharacterized protein [Antennarius striatus]|uniref:uncharacterized protein n=1 Tax=Antennarius striatus TaxID=241820 RepID=UPI0035B49D80